MGRDGQTSGATVSAVSKGRSHITLNRPLQLLYPLEINHPPDPKTDYPDTLNSPGGIGLENVPGENSDVSAKPQCSQRAFAKEGDEGGKTWVAQPEEDCMSTEL